MYPQWHKLSPTLLLAPFSETFTLQHDSHLSPVGAVPACGQPQHVTPAHVKSASSTASFTFRWKESTVATTCSLTELSGARGQPTRLEAMAGARAAGYPHRPLPVAALQQLGLQSLSL